ncbi:hypothetical protein [Planotetraspora mira]|uniref:Uncharacterized protein n=1 Tax=Planotetraspora mira TaxID=58121 RepID=A0A8J3X6U3_9ACTN|nr:hypothetical protein [Planotetraspora mira]GII29915.1 hypothetical protein Pmi06nite_33570 [Planotetraspora mira]
MSYGKIALMGFWGVFVVARTEAPLIRLDALKSYDGRPHECARPLDGWQIWQLDAVESLPDPPDLAVNLAHETGGPALVGFVFDSDCMGVDAYSRSTGSWATCLDRQNMDAYYRLDGLAVDDCYLSCEKSAEEAVKWAADAGYRVPAEPIAEVLRSRSDPFAEDLFFEFVQRLGIPYPADESE